PTSPRRKPSASGARGIDQTASLRAKRSNLTSLAHAQAAEIASSACGLLAMTSSFIHDSPPQRVVFGAGRIACIADEAARLGTSGAVVIAAPGSGARLGAGVAELLGSRSAGLHAHAVIHVPRAVAEAGLAAAKAARADGLVAAGGGSAIGLAKIIARD